MKPFDLAKALAGEPVVTRGGLQVKRVIHIPETNDLSAKILAVGHNSILGFRYEDGRTSEHRESSLDLFMAPKKRTVWVNLYRGGASEWFEREEYADHAALLITRERIGKAIPVEIEE